MIRPEVCDKYDFRFFFLTKQTKRTRIIFYELIKKDLLFYDFTITVICFWYFIVLRIRFGFKVIQVNEIIVDFNVVHLIAKEYNKEL